MSYRFFSFIRFLLLLLALVLASFLAFGDMFDDTTLEPQRIFVLDSNMTMNTEDIRSGSQYISRFQAAKSLIHQLVIADPQLSYGLILFNAQADYIIPPTFDTGHFLLYLSGLTTNLLPQGHKDFAALTGLLYDSSASYLVLSDFDASDSDIFLPSTVSLIGLGSLAGDKVRYSNGIQYYDHGKSVFSARGDRLAKSFDLPYSVIDTTDALSSERVRSSVANVPLSQRILLYTLLGIVVIIACLL